MNQGERLLKSSSKPSRLFFIDNIRIWLVTLVIVFHLAITYGSPVGSWFYYESQAGVAEGALYAWFIGVSQAFFMGLYVLLSAYFTPSSLERKGPASYFKDRMLRLGIPLAIFILVFDPIMNYAVALTKGFIGSFLSFLSYYISNYRTLGSGPLWFLEMLLIFSCAYLLWCKFTKYPSPQIRFPSNASIILFALGLGLATFIVRIWIPIGSFDFLNFQLGFFPQYIALFIVGVVAYRNNWFMQIPKKTGKICLGMAVALLFLLPVIMFAGIPSNYNLSIFLGGFYWQAAAYAFWEQAIGIAIIISLIVLFKERWNFQGRLARTLSANAFSAYVLFSPVIVFLALSLRSLSLDPMLKFALVSPIAVSLCFGISYLIRRLPYAQRIL